MTKLCRTWIVLTLLTLLGGCGLRGDVDLLEARLREQEDRLYALDTDVNKAHSQLASLRRENDMLYARLAGHSAEIILPEQADSLFRAEGIRIQKWMTGGLDRDNQPGDEMLIAVISPHDAEGETVKLPGTIQIQLIDPSKPKQQQQIGNWTFEREESRKYWHSGIMASGYQFRLPWQIVPNSSELLLNATLTTVDNRQFSTSEIIRITPPPKAVATNTETLPGRFLAEEAEPIFEASSSEANTAAPFPVNEIEGPLKSSIEPISGKRSNLENGDLKPFNSSPPWRTSDNWTEQTIPRLR